MSRPLLRLLCGAILAAAASGAFGQAADGTIRFEITRFELAGNTLLPPAALEAAVKPMTGANRDFGDVQRAIEAVEALYHARGYKLVTVSVPEQELNRGVVRLQVRQTRLGRVKVSGNRHFDEASVRNSMPTLVPGQTPNLDQVSANLKLANENPARKISMKLQSGEGDDEVDARLEVSDESPWKAMLNLDNTGSKQTGKTHAGVVLQHANVFGLDHVASFQYTTTAEEPSKISVFGLGYHIPLYRRGDSLDLYASYSDVNSGNVSFETLNMAISGKGSVFGARYNQVLARRGDFEQRLSYGFDVKAYKNSVLFAGQDFGDDVTVHPLSIGWIGMRSGADTDTSLSLTLVRNIPGGSRGRDVHFDDARDGAKAGYTLLRFGGAYTYAFPSQWQLRALASGQLSGDALVSGEQFGAGGSTSVRGFDERVLSFDSGVGLNLEAFTPNLCGSAGWQCRALGFADLAHGKRNKVITGELDSGSISSAGLGLRLSRGQSFQLQLDWGHVLDAGPVTGADKNKVHLRAGFAY
jgi:hemolysin activation/secretion protein